MFIIESFRIESVHPKIITLLFFNAGQSVPQRRQCLNTLGAVVFVLRCRLGSLPLPDTYPADGKCADQGNDRCEHYCHLHSWEDAVGLVSIVAPQTSGF